MADSDALERENAALRERLSRLSAASLRINESLDFDAVLQGALDSARSLTGARYGVLTTLGDDGSVEDFLSSGLTAEESELVWLMPQGERIFESLTSISEPMRIPDLAEHVRAQGFGDFSIPLPVRSLRFMAAPVLHRGARVGHVFVGDREDGEEFSRADEETLVMFAAQAALVIANARTHREERQARADLETLVETSPVGVVLFDAPSGTLRSLNREAWRIVEAVRDPGQSPEELLGALGHRRADGREFSPAESPLARALGTGETVRAEEIVLQAPDGRRVNALVNATPIRSAEGQVESVVVTVQDLAPLEDLERMRADFLAMVSHELRSPLSSIKGSAATLLRQGLALDPAASVQFHRIIDLQADHMEELITDLLDVARIQSGELAIQPEAVALDVLVDAARTSFRSGDAAHELATDLPAGLARVMADRRRVVQVLLNLLNNAARHSPGAPAIRVSAAQEDVQVRVTVADDGVGIAPERLPELFRTFSREPGGGDGDAAAGSGLGLAICKGIVEAHGGRIWAESEGPGEGAQFHFTLPAVEPAALPPEPGTARPGRGQFRILAVDDDPQTLRYMREVLVEADCDPVLTGDPEAVRPLIAEHRPHLVLLDLMLPGTDGMALMEELPELRERPVIFVSAYGGDQRITRALELGADDYIVKPFSPTELIARIRTVLRRSASAGAGQPEPFGTYRWGELAIDYGEQLVTLAGRPLDLTYLEQRMIFELALRAGEVLSHAELLPRVWGPAHSGRTGAVRTLVKQLRRKLGDDAEHPTYIFNVPRVGYRMPRPDGADGQDAEE